jgi:UDP-4-amino-4-deoxy-L-arabinose-oxoglutarate aminotransferase
MEELGKRNIGTGLHLRAVHLQQYYMEHMGTKRGILPETDESDVDDVVGAIRDVLGGGR